MWGRKVDAPRPASNWTSIYKAGQLFCFFALLATLLSTEPAGDHKHVTTSLDKVTPISQMTGFCRLDHIRGWEQLAFLVDCVGSMPEDRTRVSIVYVYGIYNVRHSRKRPSDKTAWRQDVMDSQHARIRRGGGAGGTCPSRPSKVSPLPS